MHSQPRMRAPRVFVLLAVGLFVGACVGNDGPTSVEQSVRIELQPALIPSPADASALPVQRIRAVVARQPDGVVLREQRFEVSPTAPAWTVEVNVPADGEPTVIVYLYLLNVAGDGTESVQFSGRTPPIAVTAGGPITGVDADLVRGPLSNLSVTGVSITAYPDTLPVGRRDTLSAVATMSASGVPTVFWTSLDASVLTMSDSVATAVAVGSARVVASAGAHTDTVSVVVIVPPVDSVEVSPSSATLFVGQTRAFTAQLRDATGALVTGRVVRWSTANPTVATVDSITGVVTAVALGATTVRATSEGQFDEATLTVVAVPVRSVRVSPDSAVVQAGATTAYTAQTFDSIGGLLTGRVVTWSTASSAVATVNGSGTVSGVSVGSTTVRATSEGVFDDAGVRVTAAPTGGGATITWTRNGSGNWSNGANWSLARAPQAGDTVRITLGADYAVTLDVDATVAKVVVGADVTSLDVGDRTLTVTGTGFGPELEILAGANLAIGSGTVVVDGITNLGSVRSTGLASIQADSIDNDGEWRAEGGVQILGVPGGSWFQTDSTVAVAAGALIQFGPDMDVHYGTVPGSSIQGTGALLFQPGSSITLHKDLLIDGPQIVLQGVQTFLDDSEDITIGPTSVLQIIADASPTQVGNRLTIQGVFLSTGGQATISSLYVAAGGSVLVADAGSVAMLRTQDVENLGTILLSGTSETHFGPGDASTQITNRAGGFIETVPGGARFINGELINEGTLIVAGPTELHRVDALGNHRTANHLNSGTIETIGADLDIVLGGVSPSITNSGAINVGAATTLAVINLSNGQVIQTSTGVIEGSGTVDVTVGTPTGVNNGTIAAGVLGPGALAWRGSIPMGPTGNIDLFLEGTTPGSGHDQINVTGTLFLDGNGELAVNVVGGFIPSDGDRFAVLTFGARSGTFGSVVLPGIAGMTFDTVWAEAGAVDTLFIEASGGTPPANLNRWTGAVSGNWSAAGNWSKGAVPVAGDSVVIDLPGTFQVTLSTDVSVSALTMGRVGSLPTLALAGPGHTLTVAGPVWNSGIISFQDNLSNGAPMTLAAGGGIAIISPGIIVAQGSGDVPRLVGAVINTGTIWTQSQGMLLPALPSIAHFNIGLIDASGGSIIIQLHATSSLTNQGSLLVQSGRTITVEGGTLTNRSAGIVRGDGTLDVSTTLFSNEGIIAPGVANGILNIDGEYWWESGSSLLIDIAGLTPGAYDQLVNTGEIALDGTLRVDYFSFTPQVGDRFAVMTFASRLGTFASVDLPVVSGVALDTVWAETGAVDTLYLVARAAQAIPLGGVIGPAGTDADAADAPGNAVNLVGTALNAVSTTLAAGGGTLPTANFNNLGGVDRTNGFDRSDLLAVRADQKHDGTALLLDLDNDGAFGDETPQPGIGMHANRFVTFDLDVIRAAASLPLSQLFTLTGVAGPANAMPSTGMALAVLVDGIPFLIHDVGVGATTSQAFSIPVSGSARYLTFVALVGVGLEEFFDHGGFAQVTLSY